MPRMVQSLPSDNLILEAKAFAERALLNLLAAHDAIIDSRIHQMHHANRCRRDKDVQSNAVELLKPGDKVCLFRENFNLPKSVPTSLRPNSLGLTLLSTRICLSHRTHWTSPAISRTAVFTRNFMSTCLDGTTPTTIFHFPIEKHEYTMA